LPVAIVGAGVSGLSAAWRLRRAGLGSPIVFELEAQPGGTATYGTDGVAPYPWGAHYLPVPQAENRALVTLLEEMGVVRVGSDGSPQAAELGLVRAPEERLFYEGQWHEGLFPSGLGTAADHEQLRKFQREVDRWVAYRDREGRRAFTIPLSRCSRDPEVTRLDRESAAVWLDRHELRSPVLRWFVEYACRDDYGTKLDTTSAWAMLFYFAARVPEPGAESAPFLTWPEGNGHLVAHLARTAGKRLVTGKIVSDVRPDREWVELTAYDTRTGAPSLYRVDHVILAVPRFVAGRLLASWRLRPPGFIRSFTYAPWLVATLHLRRRPQSPGFPLAWDNVLYDSPALGYVVATHQELSDYGPTIWTYYQALTDPDPNRARHQLALLDHGTICDAIFTDLSRAHDGLEEAVQRIDVWKWGHAMVRPTPGFIWGLARRVAGTSLGRVHFAHSDLSGLPLFEEAFDHGVRAAETVLEKLGYRVTPLSGSAE
jgi:protoporphyrinogen oxidase